MNKPIIITLSIHDYLDKAFKLLPANAIIHKGRCGIGGTTIEILALRCSIIIVPTKGIITDKINQHPELFAVQGKVTPEMIADYLTSDVKHKKIITTPDSFEKIIIAAGSKNILDALYRNFFLLFDESHAAITEAFRENILCPFKYLWNFKNKTFISATPYEFSDPMFNTLQVYQIEFNEASVGNLKLVNTTNVDDCVDFYIKNEDKFPGNFFFFYNSVTEIAEVIKRNNIKDANIYCADKEENFEKLAENLQAFQQEPTTGNYKKFNFFTSKYFEGFDLREENATIFLVTDIHKGHTKVGISNKGVQAAGRIRNKPHQIIHITNNRNITEMKTLQQFKKEYEIHTKQLITGYNNYIDECRAERIEPLESSKEVIKRFTDINEETLEATLNSNKLDQVLNELACNEEYNNLDAITKAWEKSLYKVTQETFTNPIPSTKGRQSKANKLKELVNLIHELETNKASYVMNAASKQLSKIQTENKLAFEAYFVLGLDVLEEIEYNLKTVEQRLRRKHNENAETKLLAFLDAKYQQSEKFTIDEMVKDLQYGYNLFQVRNEKTGEIEIAKATHFGKPGRYSIHKDKKDGKHAYLITEKHFQIKKAA